MYLALFSPHLSRFLRLCLLAAAAETRLHSFPSQREITLRRDRASVFPLVAVVIRRGRVHHTTWICFGPQQQQNKWERKKINKAMNTCNGLSSRIRRQQIVNTQGKVRH